MRHTHGNNTSTSMNGTIGGPSTSDNMDVSMLIGNSAEPQPKASGSIFANKTKPINNNKFQKRLGAKKAKKLELDKNQDFTRTSS
mgnify:CR=1 FL=1